MLRAVYVKGPTVCRHEQEHGLGVLPQVEAVLGCVCIRGCVFQVSGVQGLLHCVSRVLRVLLGQRPLQARAGAGEGHAQQWYSRGNRALASGFRLQRVTESQCGLCV